MRSSIVPALLGATFTILGGFLFLALWASLFGIFVPFGGEVHGWEAVEASPFVMIIIGTVCGGFAILGIGGAIGGVVVKKHSEKPNLLCVKIVIVSLVIDCLYFAGLYLYSIADG